MLWSATFVILHTLVSFTLPLSSWFCPFRLRIRRLIEEKETKTEKYSSCEFWLTEIHRIEAFRLRPAHRLGTCSSAGDSVADWTVCGGFYKFAQFIIMFWFLMRYLNERRTSPLRLEWRKQQKWSLPSLIKQ